VDSTQACTKNHLAGHAFNFPGQQLATWYPPRLARPGFPGVWTHAAHAPGIEATWFPAPARAPGAFPAAAPPTPSSPAVSHWPQDIGATSNSNVRARTPGAWYPPSASELAAASSPAVAGHSSMQDLPAMEVATSAFPADEAGGRPTTEPPAQRQNVEQPKSDVLYSDLLAIEQDAAFSKAAAAARAASEVASKAAGPCDIEPSLTTQAIQQSNVVFSQAHAIGERVGQDQPAATARIELGTFIGNWKDSIGHAVSVEWAKNGSRNGQLDVLLKKPSGNRDSIRLNVKQSPAGHFTCGHYDLDAERSHARKIVWNDCRSRGKVSVWER